MTRDVAFAHEVTRQARQHRRRVIIVDGTIPLEPIFTQVATHLTSPPAAVTAPPGGPSSGQPPSML